MVLLSCERPRSPMMVLVADVCTQSPNVHRDQFPAHDVREFMGGSGLDIISRDIFAHGSLLNLVVKGDVGDWIKMTPCYTALSVTGDKLSLIFREVKFHRSSS